jgi:bifunctional non-homologous end joining protein LigD
MSRYRRAFLLPARGTVRRSREDPERVESQLRAIERDGGDGEVDFGGRRKLHVSSLDKVYFPKAGVTKGALMRYYARIWPVLQPHVADRPLILKRHPDGVGGQMFFQQNAGPHVPEGVRVATLDTVDEGPKPRIIGGDLLTLLYTVQLGAIEVHPWLSRVKTVDFPDHSLIDLDPADDVPFGRVVELARDILKIARQCELPMAVKTSGSSGIHLVIPLPKRTSYEVSAELAMRLASVVAAHQPDRATVERSIGQRPKGTIYVDAMQNSRGKSMASAYSVRAKPMATVSTPLRERELTARLRTAAFSLKTVAARVTRSGDTWGEALAKPPTTATLRHAMRALEQVLENAPQPTTRSRGANGHHGATSSGRRRRSA